MRKCKFSNIFNIWLFYLLVINVLFIIFIVDVTYIINRQLIQLIYIYIKSYKETCQIL